jgi:putative ABC transport system permease protein
MRRAPAEHGDILRRDVRLALRTLAARPLATAASVLTLAVGLGANMAMFAVVQAVLLSPLPYRDSDRLVIVQETKAGGPGGPIGYLTFTDVAARARSFSTLAAAVQSSATLTGGGRDAERVNAMRVSRSYFDMIGIQPSLGRAFTDAEDKPGPARRVVILSDALWRRRFGARADVIGAPLLISGLEYRIVGVMPAGFNDLVAARMYNGAQLWYPLGYDPAASNACRTCRHLRVFGRLSPGVPASRATAELTELFGALEREDPASYSQAGGVVTPLGDLLLGPVRPVLIVLWVSVGVLLLVACGNVAHVLLLRASERAQEVAVRTALGVTRTRLARQFLTESVLLACTGGALGVALAWVAIRVAVTEGPAQIPRLADAGLNGPVLLAGAGLTLLCGLTFGLVPLRQLLNSSGTLALRSGTRGTESRATWRARTLLVGANVAMAAMLLVGSGLLVRSLTGVLAVAPGLESAGVLTMKLWATGERFRAGETSDQIAQAVRFYDDVLTRAAALPGVTHAAAVTTLPLGGDIDGYGLHIAGRLTANPEDAPSADRFVVTPHFFAAAGIPLVRGRLLDERDTQRAEPVVVIGSTAASSLFGGADPIGQRVSLGPPTAPARTIVGIVGDVRHHGLDEPAGYQVYVPHAQWAWAETFLTLVIRTSGDPSLLAGPMRDVVRTVDPAQPLTDIRTYDDVIGAGTGTRRFAAMLLSAFAATSVILAIVGLYGSVALMVAQRRREIGVRLALGASTANIRQLIFSRGLRPVMAGLAAGLALAALAVPGLESMLYNLEPLDPLTFLTATAALGVVALAACLGPARRAGRIDPATAVRD